MADLPNMTPEQDAAFRDAITAYTGASMVTGYTVVAETLSVDDGAPTLAFLADEDSTAWAVLGLLTAAAASLQREVVNGLNTADDD